MVELQYSFLFLALLLLFSIVIVTKFIFSE